MDTATAIIIIIALFALIVVAGFIVYRQRSSVDIDTPLGSLKMKSSNDPPPTQPGVTIEDATSRSGGIEGRDKTGRGAALRQVDAHGDIRASSETPDSPPDPKA
jgi:FtsZ-interacting cell division protein ZipA